MLAHARIAVEGAAGRARLTELVSDPPLTVRATPDPSRPGVASVHVVGSGAAPLGGDQLRLDLRVGPAATLDVATVAAALAQPDPLGRPSALAVDVEVGAGAVLRWSAQPVVAVRGCDHHTTTVIRLAPGASVVWLDQVVLGRHREAPGSIAQRVDVEVVGRPLLRTEVALGPRHPGSLGPGGLGSAMRTAGSVLVVGPGRERAAAAWPALVAAAASDGVRAAVLPLDGPGVLLSAVAARPGALGRWLALAADLAAGADPHHGVGSRHGAAPGEVVEGPGGAVGVVGGAVEGGPAAVAGGSDGQMTERDS